eukprot:896792-Prymnesium_polylepis.1
MSKTARPAHASLPRSSALPSDVPPRRPVTLVTSDRPRTVTLSLHFNLATVYKSLTVAKYCISRHGRHT